MEGKTNLADLCRYCLTELPNQKYTGTDMLHGFSDLLLELDEVDEGAKEFIELQDKLLHEVKNKRSIEAQKILERKILFYKKHHQPEAALILLQENIQIIRFRKLLIEHFINIGEFKKAKKLITDFLLFQRDGFHENKEWYHMLLSIAKKERDIPEILKIAFYFISHSFNHEYYQIYKSHFSQEEWPTELNNIINHFQRKENVFSYTIAKILVEEGDTIGLLSYLQRYPSLYNVNEYYHYTSAMYPLETLELFQIAINEYLEKHTSKVSYNYILSMFKKVLKIDGGREKVKSMISEYNILYSGRSAMIEIFSNIKL